jgi:hypothetical protein
MKREREREKEKEKEKALFIYICKTLTQRLLRMNVRTNHEKLTPNHLLVVSSDK